MQRQPLRFFSSRLSCGFAKRSFTKKPPLVMIPGPTECHPDVLAAIGQRGTSHLDPKFIQLFSKTIRETREVFLAPDGQPILITGSGTLGWDLIATNLVKPGDTVVLVNTGYFGDRWGDCFETYGVKVHHVRASPGDRPSVEEIVKAVEQHKDKVTMVALTHVDTSTGVRTNIQRVTEAVKHINPNILVAVDGVCALAGEELHMLKWNIDAYMTGSQKAIGAPVGLSITVLRPNALEAADRNKDHCRNYYASVSRWLPIMRNYEDQKPSYFATPAVNNIVALHEAYKILLSGGSMPQRFAEHTNVATHFREAVRMLGLQFIPINEDYAANTMSAIKYPEFKQEYDASQFQKLCSEFGAIFAGGLHSEIQNSYFRVGHMGHSTRTPEHIRQTVSVLQQVVRIVAKEPSSEDAVGMIERNLMKTKE